MTETTITPNGDNTRALRDALGCFGTGVTVVTSLSPTGPIAMTANSFTSVSLNPPMVIWCPSRASLRHDAFTAAERYIIHVMAEDQQALATHFARTGDDFTGVDWQPDETGLPVLAGCLARFACTRKAVHDGGDHSIILGQVDSATHRPGLGLMFKRGQYGGFLGLE